MEEERPDFRVPIISGLFFVSSITGGILLIIWLFDNKDSQPWFPILALILISLPWVFWFLTYIYTFIKACFRGDGGRGVSRDVSRRPTTKRASSSSSVRDSSVDSPTGKRQVQFGAVVVMDNGGDSAGDVSVASSKECEMPLNQAAPSWEYLQLGKCNMCFFISPQRMIYFAGKCETMCGLS